MQISFQSKNCCFMVEFNNSVVAKEISKHLPFDSKVSIWGEALHFKTNIIAPGGEETMEVAIGDVVYLPKGQCICVFFGRTPASSGDKPVPESPVVIIGKTAALPAELKKIEQDHPIRVISVEENPSASMGAAIADRKLSQREIDLLIPQLLAEMERKKKEAQNNPA
ncbi:MAG: cyclophilin-like family protein [Candidatus Omnitrophica bacterium]|nr:cyclophilin-like family protein [Candidatus Omnitrophota bacterium]